MASEDVIELGSSDDEAEPTMKKMKPTPNAMVHIPTKLHDVTIKPAKSNILTGIPRGLAGKNVTITKIQNKGSNVLTNPYATKKKLNGKQIPMKPILPKQIQQKQILQKQIPILPQIPQKQIPSFPQIPKKPLVLNKTNVNPLSIMKKINSQVVINKVPTTPKVFKNAIKVHSPHTINNLPPSITVTRTAGGKKRVAPSGVSNPAHKKQKRNIPKTAVGEVLTVDLDDDEGSSTSTASPQWYLRPEEQSTTLEEENNTEPEAKKEMIAITIEDSPAKPVKDKKSQKDKKEEVSAEQTVTIDDSPVKITVEKNKGSGSDGEVKLEGKVPHSKKKLEYPKESEEISSVMELEITPEDAKPLEEVNMAEPEPKQDNDIVIEIEESPLKVDGQGASTPKKGQSRPPLAVPDSIKELATHQPQVTDELSEFHPVYQSFIKLCFQLENSEDMKKIVEKKIKTYYRQVPKEYTESEEFIDMVAGKVLLMKAGPEKMYLYIKDIVDELNLQRKMAKSQVLSNITEKKSSDGEKYFYDSEFDSKRQRQIRKLEKTLKKLHRAIQKLEDQEVDFDDEEDSVYLLTESDEGSTSNKDSDKQLEKNPKALLQRYKERMVRVHAKFCQLTNTKMPSEPRVSIDPRPGQAPGPAKRLEKWVNKKVPIGTPLPFPDFHDVLRCVREANEEDKLGWNEAGIMEEARDLFTRCGKKLQRRRQENEWRIAASRIATDVDPAEKNKELLKKLDDNKEIAAKKETEVFNKYADRQSQLKLEAEEIGDKEAEESPGDDDDEEEIQRAEKKSSENKEERKERLKMIFQDKSEKMVLEKHRSDVEDEKDTELQDEECKEGEIDSLADDNNEHQNNEMDNQNIGDTNKSTEIDNKQQEATKISEKQDVSESESVKTIDSDTVEIVTNEKDNKTNPPKITEVENIESEKLKEGDANTDMLASEKSIEKAHSISDDSSKVESDVDNLHLLQKHHSENELINTSTLDSSDSDMPVAISDTIGSSSDSKKQRSSDIISIENSSYSESEIKDDLPDIEEADSNTNNVVEETVDDNIELECSNNGVKKKHVRTNNDEYNESIEDILLASTDDDELETDKNMESVIDEECVNLKDDNISIGDTVVEGINKEQSGIDSTLCRKQDDASSVDSLPCVSLKNDSSDEPNMDVDQSVENIGNSKVENKNRDFESVDKNFKINSIEKNSDDYVKVQSVNMIEVKESTPEKAIEVIESTSQHCKNKQEIAEEEKGIIEETIFNEGEMENSAEVISDTLRESANSLDAEEKEYTQDITDAIADSKKSDVSPEIASDQIVESNESDNTSDKL